MGVGPSRFPATPWSTILRAGTRDESIRQDALHRLLRVYWRPIYVYIRRRWGKSNEDAKDLTQEFIVTVLKKGLFSEADRERGTFRSLLRKTLQNFLRNQYAETRAQRRGGNHRIVSLDAAAKRKADALIQDSDGPEQAFRLEWMRTLFTAAVMDLRRSYAAEGKTLYMEVFDRYQLSGETDVSYDSVAKELNLKIWDVTNYLADARRRLRNFIQARVRHYCLSEDDFREEMADLLGRF